MRTPAPAKTLLLLWVVFFSWSAWADVKCNGKSDPPIPFPSQTCETWRKKADDIPQPPSEWTDGSVADFKTKMNQYLGFCCDAGAEAHQAYCGGGTDLATEVPEGLS